MNLGNISTRLTCLRYGAPHFEWCPIPLILLSAVPCFGDRGVGSQYFGHLWALIVCHAHEFAPEPAEPKARNQRHLAVQKSGTVAVTATQEYTKGCQVEGVDKGVRCIMLLCIQLPSPEMVLRSLI